MQLKRTTQLKKDIGPKASFHSKGEVEILEAAVEKVWDTLDRYKLSEAATKHLELGYKGIVEKVKLKPQPEPVAPVVAKKPALNTSDMSRFEFM